MDMKYFVEYNGKFMAMYKSVRACLNFISRKGYRNSYYNSVNILDEEGNMYDTENGEMLEC